LGLELRVGITSRSDRTDVKNTSSNHDSESGIYHTDWATTVKVPLCCISQTKLRGYLPKNGTIQSTGNADIQPHHSVYGAETMTTSRVS